MSVGVLSNSLRFQFPEGLSAPNRIVYVLARTGGGGCYSTVRLRTGLAHREFAAAVDLLRRAHKVRVEELPDLSSPGGHKGSAEPLKISLAWS
jgi:hypothetical protein